VFVSQQPKLIADARRGASGEKALGGFGGGFYVGALVEKILMLNVRQSLPTVQSAHKN
jgi:hypothetical protein